MDAFTTQDLLGVVRQLDKFDPLLLNLFFPREVNFDKEEILLDSQGLNLQLAPFVAPTVQGKVVKHQQTEARMFKPAYVKPKHAVTPSQTIARQAGEAPGGALTPQQRREAKIVELLDEQRRMIFRRWEWMAAQALRTGTVTVSGDDYPEREVDFRRAAGNTIALAGGDKWDQSGTATPLEDVEDWAAQAEAPIQYIIFGQGAWRKFVSFSKVKEAIDNNYNGQNSAMNLAPGNGDVAQFKGLLSGNIQLWVYTGFYYDADGNKQLFLPTNEVILGSQAIQGVRAFGAILDHESLQPMSLFPKMWRENDPSVEYVMSQSAPLMIPQRPNASIGVTVY